MVLWFIVFDHAVHFGLKKGPLGRTILLHLYQSAFKKMQMQCTLVLQKVHHEGLFSTLHLKQNAFKKHANAVHFGFKKSPL